MRLDVPASGPTGDDVIESAETSAITSLSVVIPTRNEADNVGPLVEVLRAALDGLLVDVVFVDDSDDATPTRIREVAAADHERFSVRMIHREGIARRAGLSGAVMEGMAEARHRWVVVMDGDLQHPPATIRQMIREVEGSGAGLVLATRYVRDGSPEGLARPARRVVSAASRSTARAMFGRRLAEVSDPMTGFFLLDRNAVDLRRLRPRGFKILLEILVSHPELEVREVPFVFEARLHGSSKASIAQGWQYARQLVDLRRGGMGRMPWRYDIHGIVGVESDQRLPELDKFVCRSYPTAVPSVAVRIGDLGHLPLGESLDLGRALPIVGYRERSGFAISLELGPVNTDVVVSPFVAKSPHVLYTNVVEPVLRWRLVEFGHALIHAASFSDGERAYLVTARTDTGKTTTMLKVLNRSDLSFVSDDLVVVSPDGVVRTFPKPLTISAHTVHALEHTDLSRLERLALVPQSRLHSREGRLLAFVLTRYRLPVASINAIIQRLVPPPKYHVERLVRGVSCTGTARACGMFIIQRGGEGEEAIGGEEALSILLSNCDDAFGFPPYSSLERLLLAASDHDLRADEEAIIRSAIAYLPVMVMRSETLDWAERIRRLVRSPEEPELQIAGEHVTESR
jgi:hypothetical protein